MIRHTHTKRVRYGETDQMGYLYYGNYALYFEIGRVELMRSLGLSYKHIEEDLGIMMPVLNMNVRYLRPARFDEEISIRTEIRKIPNKEIVFHFELFNEPGKLTTGGRVTLCFIEIATNSRISCPPVLLNALREKFA